jgi:hypothetical protein
VAALSIPTPHARAISVSISIANPVLQCRSQ